MNQKDLSQKEKERYGRHLILPDFGLEAQLKLKNASVLVVGAGGLGCPVLQYLAAAGVGHIGIVDFDIVEESNLQRQILYTIDDIGKSKAQVAKLKLEKLNPHLKITVFATRIVRSNVLDIIEDFDIVADGTDNFTTRYLINDACVLVGKPNVFASIFRFEGQVAVFNFLKKDGTRGVNYRDLHPEPPKEGLVPNCAEGGVLGVLPGIIGSMQASEVIKVITGVGEPLIDRIFIFDAASFSSHILKIKKNSAIEITALPEEVIVCESPQPEISEMSAAFLKNLIETKVDFQLIDVREPHEFTARNIGGELIPLSKILELSDQISRVVPVVIHCQSGARSRKAIELLQREKAFTNLNNLKGGLIEFY